jgi:hypothetical protein
MLIKNCFKKVGVIALGFSSREVNRCLPSCCCRKIKDTPARIKLKMHYLERNFEGNDDMGSVFKF